MKERTYICCDLKSFYASVECVERGLDPMTTNLVVADKRRTEKTICLAVSPSLKAYGISGRARLFEVVQKVRGGQRPAEVERSRTSAHRFLLARSGGAGRIPRWPWTTSWPRPGWPTISTGAPRSTASI